MAYDQALRSVLVHLKRSAPRLEEGSSDLSQADKQLLAALLLLTAAEQSNHRARSKTIEALYEKIRQLVPEDVACALPFPDGKHLQQASSLLPVPPHKLALLDPLILSYLYQFFCSARRESAKQRIQSADKTAQANDTIAFTQLYTPTHVVDYLLKQSLRTKADTILDPSCGAGSILTRAFDALLAMKLEDGMKTQAAVSSILEKSIAGCDIDRIGLWVTALSVAVNLKKHEVDFDGQLSLAWFKPEVNEPLLGALHKTFPQGHILTRAYDAVVGNPPYLGRKLLDRKTKEKLKELYPDVHQDLCNAFIERGLKLLKDGGRLAYITQSSLLYLPTYAAFRKALIEKYRIVSILEVGAGVFPLLTGQKVQSVLIVLQNSLPNGTKTICAADDGAHDVLNGKQDPLGNGVTIDQKQFLQHRGNAFHYRCPQVVIQIRSTSTKLSEIAEIRQGLATSDNNRFIKWWWQVPKDQLNLRYIPYVKGAGSERWYAPIKTVIDWQDDGAALKQAVAEAYPYLEGKTAWVVKNERFYFKPGLTFSLVNTKQLCVRELPEGCIFDVAGSAVFPHDGQDAWLLAFLNSSMIAAQADILNPTVNYQVGDLKELPVIPLSASTKKRLATLALNCVSSKKQLCAYLDSDMQTRQVEGPVNKDTFDRHYRELESLISKLTETEKEIDELVLSSVYDHFQLSKVQYNELTALSQDAATRRKSVALPFLCLDDYARFHLRTLLYALAPGTYDEDQLCKKAAGNAEFFKAAIGTTLSQYVQKQFEADQRKQLNGTVRVSVENAGLNAAQLSNIPFEYARSRS